MVETLLFGFLQEAGGFLLVRVDEGGVDAGLLDLRNVSGEIDLALLAGHVRRDVDAGLFHFGEEDVVAALAKIVIDPIDRHLFGLQRVLQIGGQRGHAFFGARGRAEDVAVALLRDVRRLGAGELRHARLLRDNHVDDGRPGIDRARDHIGAAVDHFLHEGARRLRVRRGVVVGHLDLFAENAARRVNLVDGEMRAVAEVRAGDCAGSAELTNTRNDHRVGGIRGARGRPRQQRRSQKPSQSDAKVLPFHVVALPEIPISTGLIRY